MGLSDHKTEELLLQTGLKLESTIFIGAEDSPG